MRIRWTPAAATDLQRMNDYLEKHRPLYRDATVRHLYRTIDALKRSPWRGRAGREEGTRGILFPPMPYIAVYRLHAEAIEVVRIFHTAQDRAR